MYTAFVLLKLKAGKEQDVYKGLMKFPEIQGLRQVFGDFDIIARIETNDFKNIREIVLNKIRSVDGILHTTTLISVEE
jgi:DNA-binding Lrp family transcriptional regulator